MRLKIISNLINKASNRILKNLKIALKRLLKSIDAPKYISTLLLKAEKNKNFGNKPKLFFGFFEVSAKTEISVHLC